MERPLQNRLRFRAVALVEAGRFWGGHLFVFLMFTGAAPSPFVQEEPDTQADSSSGRT